MSNLQEIERAVSQLSPEELAAFRVWFAEFDAEIWDLQFEEDVAAGRLMIWLNEHCNICGKDVVPICEISCNP
jgi:hypothetical protein